MCDAPTTPATQPTPHDMARGHLRAALAEFRHLQKESGRSDAGRAYSILITDLEKLLAAEAFYFPEGDDGRP